MPNDFLYDDFFSPADAPGYPATIEVRGRTIPIELKQMPWGDLQAIMLKSSKITYGEDGVGKIVPVNEAEGNDLMICSTLIKWGFTYRDGTMVPINKQTLHDIDPDVYPIILKKVTEFVQKGKDQINGPFVKPSGAAS